MVPHERILNFNVRVFLSNERNSYSQIFHSQSQSPLVIFKEPYSLLLIEGSPNLHCSLKGIIQAALFCLLGWYTYSFEGLFILFSQSRCYWRFFLFGHQFSLLTASSSGLWHICTLKLLSTTTFENLWRKLEIQVAPKEQLIRFVGDA